MNTDQKDLFMSGSMSTDMKALEQMLNINNNKQNLNSFVFLKVNKPFWKIVANVRIHGLIQDKGKIALGNHQWIGTVKQYQ